MGKLICVADQDEDEDKTELIGITEAARRLGCSKDTVSRALEYGRITCAKRTAVGHRLVEWPSIRLEWAKNTSKHHRGDRGPDLSDLEEEAGVARSDAGAGSKADYNKARAEREVARAEKEQLELEKLKGSLVSIEEVRRDANQIGALLKKALFSIPDRISCELSGMTDQQEIFVLLRNELREAMETVAERMAK